jgi:hypothetical protein
MPADENAVDHHNQSDYGGKDLAVERVQKNDVDNF